MRREWGIPAGAEGSRSKRSGGEPDADGVVWEVRDAEQVKADEQCERPRTRWNVEPMSTDCAAGGASAAAGVRLANSSVTGQIDTARIGRKVVSHQPRCLVGFKLTIVEGNDPCPFLPSMLLGVQRKRGVERCIIQTIDGKQAALFF